MKIAYILPSLRNQGPVIVAKNLTDYLVAWGHTVDVYYFDELPSAMEFSCPTIRISMKEPIDFDKYDVIHSHGLRPDKYVAKWRKRIHKAKMVSTLHQDTYRSFYYKFNIILAYFITKYWCHFQSKFDGVISISNQLKKSYESRIKTPITTIYNGCSAKIDKSTDKEMVTAIENLKSKYKTIGTYARVTRIKGLEQVIKVLPDLPDYAFVIIGEGPEVVNLKRMSQDIGVSDRVLFLPYQKNPCIYLPYFDLYAMPSYYEGFGMAMVEAALAKRAIVCSDIPSFHEIFPNGEACFFELNNMDSLRKAIDTAFENREKYSELAYVRAAAEFTTQKMTENHLKYYQSLITI